MMLEQIRWLRYFLPVKASYPIYLLFFITSKCMGRCRHCFYWRSLNRDENPLSLEEIEKISRSIGKLLQLTITGGEPLLRDDLAEIFKIFYRYNQPFNLGLATSGYFPQKLEKILEGVLRDTPESNFTVGLPVEGPPELNDYIRGLKSAFEKTQESINILKKMKTRYHRLNILVDITASAFNQDYLVETYQIVRDRMKPDLINLIITRGEPKDPEAKKVNPDKIQAVLKLMEDDIKSRRIPGYRFSTRILHAKDIILRRKALDFFRGRKPRLRCQAGNLIGVIYPEGQVYICELWKEQVGNLRDFGYDFKKVWQSQKAEEMRGELKRMNCICYHQCFLSPSLFFDPYYLPKILREMF